MGETDLVHAVSSVVSLLGLGLVMGFSPTLYGLLVHLLTRSAQARRSILYMACGLAVGATALVLLFRVVDPETLTTALRGRVDELLVRRGVDLGAGALFVIGGATVGWQARRPGRAASPVPAPTRESHPRRMFLAGLSNALIGVSGIATMYVTGRVITGISHDVIVRLGAYGIFLVALVGPYLAIVWAWQAFPAFARQITRSYGWIARQDLRPVLAAGLLVAGLAFMALGIWGHR